MGKYILYAFIVFIILFGLNFFKIVDIPFLDLPDFISPKEETVTKSKESVKDLF